MACLLPVARFSSRRVSAQRTGRPGPPCQLGRKEAVVAGLGLGAEAAAHVAADDSDTVGRNVEVGRELVPDVPDPLRRGVDGQPAGFPFAHGLVRLERVVEDRLGPVLRLDHHVRLRQPPLQVAPLVVRRLVDQRAASYRLIRIEDRLHDFPLDVDELECGAGLRERVRRDRRDGRARIPGLARQDVAVVRAERRADARRGECRRQVEAKHVRRSVRASEDGGVEHAGKLDVRGVASLAAGAGGAGHPLGGPAHRVARPGGPLLELVLLDHDPLLGVAPLDFLLGPDQPRQERIASSIFG